MNIKKPGIGIDLMIMKENKVLLGLLTKKWAVKDQQVYGFPGRDILFNEKLGEAIKRNIKEEFACDVEEYKIFCTNANYEWGGHYINIGVLVKMNGEPNLHKPEDWEKWEWFDMDKIPTNIFASAKYTIDSYLSKKVCVSE